MGIAKNRLIYSNVELFLCGICKDVSIDPILLKECEHYLCRGCVPADIKECPTCESIFSEYVEIGHALNRVYNSIRLKCENNECEEVLTMENYVAHSIICPKGTYECPHCFFKIQMFLKENIRHDCITYLKEQYTEHKKQIARLEAINDERQAEIDMLNMKIYELESNNENQRPEAQDDECSDSIDNIPQKITLLEQRKNGNNRLPNKNYKLRNRIEIMEKNAAILTRLNRQLNMTGEIGADAEFKLTNDQKLFLSGFKMPTQITKLINALGDILFGDEELLKTTAGKLDKNKIRFISNFVRNASRSSVVNETMVKYRLNKKRSNLKRKFKNKDDSSAKKARK